MKSVQSEQVSDARLDASYAVRYDAVMTSRNLFHQSFFLDSACRLSFLKIFFLKEFYDAARLAQKTATQSA
jgi:hypothetical protein